MHWAFRSLLGELGVLRGFLLMLSRDSQDQIMWRPGGLEESCFQNINPHKFPQISDVYENCK